MTLIPRSLLLNKAARSAPILSPDGRQVAWLAPHAGAKNIWLADVSKLAEARSVSNETASAVREIWWSGTSGILIALKDLTGS